MENNPQKNIKHFMGAVERFPADGVELVLVNPSTNKEQTIVFHTSTIISFFRRVTSYNSTFLMFIYALTYSPVNKVRVDFHRSFYNILAKKAVPIQLRRAINNLKKNRP